MVLYRRHFGFESSTFEKIGARMLGWKVEFKTQVTLLAEQFTWDDLELDSPSKAEQLLCLAAKQGWPAMIDTVMRRYPTTPINKWYTQPEPRPLIAPLFSSAHYGHSRCVKALLARGADPNFLSHRAESPLFSAGK
jgi:hypothetical protein